MPATLSPVPAPKIIGFKGYEADDREIWRFSGAAATPFFGESSLRQRGNTHMSSIVTLPRFSAFRT
jgi:hypothetical protein